MPRDPYSLRPEHLDVVLKVVNAMIKELDHLLDGKLRATRQAMPTKFVDESWLNEDVMKIVYPTGANWDLRPPGAPREGTPVSDATDPTDEAVTEAEGKGKADKPE